MKQRKMWEIPSGIVKTNDVYRRLRLLRPPPPLKKRTLMTKIAAS
jgi:hypothetical protein